MKDYEDMKVYLKEVENQKQTNELHRLEYKKHINDLTHQLLIPQDEKII